jgi:hypothetical protein
MARSRIARFSRKIGFRRKNHVPKIIRIATPHAFVQPLIVNWPVMKPFLLALLLVGAPFLQAADAPSVTLYVQLIRGSDLDSPPAPQARLIGPRLDHRLHDVFKWKNYWEIKRQTVTLKNGAKVRARMSPQREVEIAWPGPRDMTVCIYTDGKLTRKQVQSIDTTFFIAGGDKEVGQPWFIIVRRDNPDAGQDSGAKLAGMP